MTKIWNILLNTRWIVKHLWSCFKGTHIYCYNRASGVDKQSEWFRKIAWLWVFTRYIHDLLKLLKLLYAYVLHQNTIFESKIKLYYVLKNQNYIESNIKNLFNNRNAVLYLINFQELLVLNDFHDNHLNLFSIKRDINKRKRQ